MFEKDQIIGRHFRILHHLGAGGMGKVYKAVDENLGREVAIKFLSDKAIQDKELVARFFNEGRTLATINHRCVIDIYTSETDEQLGIPFLVMEFVDGTGLEHYKEQYRQEPRRLLLHFIEILDGIHACHQKGIVHRDLKPANILVARDGQLKIVDFGIAKTSLNQTRAGVSLGTPHYMAPEQCLGKGTTSHKADIYAIGIMLWEFLTGQTPFQVHGDADDPGLAIALMHVNQALPMQELKKNPLAERLSNLLAAMLAKNPDDRPDVPIILETLKKEVALLGESASAAVTGSTPAFGLATPGLIGDIYRVEQEIGSGGMGRVYKALDTSLNRPVAIKLLNDEMCHQEVVVERFIKEGQLLATVGHPNVLSIYASVRDKTTARPFLVMEYVDGALFSELKPALLKDKLRLPGFMLQLCEGIQACHERGIIHRDLKPSNLLITRDGLLKIFDFGIAKTALKLTKTGMTIGTPQYMSPEQCMGAKEITGQSDIYSIGIIFWEFMFGRVPYEPDTGMNAELAVAMQHIQATLPMIAVDPNDPLFPLLPLVRRMLDKEPDNRPTIEEIIAGLDDFIARSVPNPVATPGTMRSRRTLKQSDIRDLIPPRQSSRFHSVGIALGFGVVIGIGLYFSLRHFTDGPVQPPVIPLPTTNASAPVPFPMPMPPSTASTTPSLPETGPVSPPAQMASSTLPPASTPVVAPEAPVTKEWAERISRIEDALLQFAPSQDPMAILEQLADLEKSGRSEEAARLRRKFAAQLVQTGDALADSDRTRQQQFLELANQVASLPGLSQRITDLKIVLEAQMAKARKCSELEASITQALESPLPLTDPPGILETIHRLASETDNQMTAEEKKILLVGKLMKDALELQTLDAARALASLRFASLLAPQNDEIRQLITSLEQNTDSANQEKRRQERKARLIGTARAVTPRTASALAKQLSANDDLLTDADRQEVQTEAIRVLKAGAGKAATLAEAESFWKAALSLVPKNSSRSASLQTDMRESLARHRKKAVDEARGIIDSAKPPARAREIINRLEDVRSIAGEEAQGILVQRTRSRYLEAARAAAPKSRKKALQILKALQAFPGLKDDVEVTGLLKENAGTPAPTSASSTLQPGLTTAPGAESRPLPDPGPQPKPAPGAVPTLVPVPVPTPASVPVPLPATARVPVPVPTQEPAPETEGSSNGDESAPPEESNPLISAIEDKLDPSRIESSVPEILELLKKIRKTEGKATAQAYQRKAAQILCDNAEEHGSNQAWDQALNLYELALKVLPGYPEAVRGREIINRASGRKTVPETDQPPDSPEPISPDGATPE